MFETSFSCAMGRLWHDRNKAIGQQGSSFDE